MADSETKEQRAGARERRASLTSKPFEEMDDKATQERPTFARDEATTAETKRHRRRRSMKRSRTSAHQAKTLPRRTTLETTARRRAANRHPMLQRRSSVRG